MSPFDIDSSGKQFFTVMVKTIDYFNDVSHCLSRITIIGTFYCAISRIENINLFTYGRVASQ